jgi:hypothetical protein
MLSVLLALSGCIPAPYGSYVRPSYPDASARLSKASCGGQAGPPAHLSFTAPGPVRFAVRASERRLEQGSSSWQGYISVAPPPGGPFQFLADTLHVLQPAGGPGEALTPQVVASISARVAAGSWVDPAVLGPTTPAVTAQAVKNSPDGQVARATLGIGKLPSQPVRIAVQLPALLTDTDRFDVPLIELSGVPAVNGASTLRTSGRQEALAQREAACEANTPRQQCRNIRLFDAYSYRFDTGPFTHVGRFWNFAAGGKVEPMRFEVQLEARTAQRWRLEAPVVAITDLATGERTEHGLEQLQVSMRHPVPLDAPLIGLNPEMLITVPLPAAGSRWLVQLRAYRVNGERYELKAIELELRRFDGGLEPFNC